MFRTNNRVLEFVAHLDFDNIRITLNLVNNSGKPVESFMGHAVVNTWVNNDIDIFPDFVYFYRMGDRG